MDKGRLVRFIRDLAMVVDALNDDELHDLLGQLNKPKLFKEKSNAIKTRSAARLDLNDIVESLKIMQSRIDALNYLDSMNLSRVKLRQIAKLVGVYVSNQDDTESLQNKIVEETIGSRLNSQAIRGDKS